MNFRSTFFAGFAFLAMLSLVPVSHARAQQASQWQDLTYGRIRLVRGDLQPDGSFDIGVQIQLAPKWKTYWRVPGDSGVPPEFDWSRSVNTADIEVQWPAPARFRDAFGESIGYQTEVVFPVVIKPADAEKTTSVHLKLHFAVCHDICAPLQADLSLDLPALSMPAEFAGLIERYQALVPKPVDQVKGLEVADARVETKGDHVDLVVDIRHSDPTPPSDVFIEGDPQYYFTTPRKDPDKAPDRTTFRAHIDGATDARSLSGSWVHFVILDGDKRVAQSWKLQ